MRPLSSLRGTGIRYLLKHGLTSPARVSIAQRIGSLRRGFLSESLVIYGRDRAEELHGYLPDRVRWARCGRINAPFHEVLNNKLIFGSLLHEIVETPVMVALISRGRIRNLADGLPLDGTGELLERYGSTPGLVFRPLYGRKGKGVHVIRFDAANGTITLDGSTVDRSQAITVLEQSTRATHYIVTVFVQQGGFGGRIYAGTTNTIRLLSMIDPRSGEPFFPIAVHRFGTRRSAPADNWSRGGLSAEINVETGVLSAAVSYPDEGALVWHEYHPETGERIAGEVVPRWTDIQSGMLALARRLHFVPYVGWDILVTTEGFTVIEGNNNTDVNLLQVHRPLLQDPRVRRFYEHHGVLR